LTCEIDDAVMPVVMFSTGRNACFTSMSRRRQHGWLRPLSADIVAKVENRTIQKTSPKRIFRRLYRCNAL
jgi:hypothetical protein